MQPSLSMELMYTSLMALSCIISEIADRASDLITSDKLESGFLMDIDL